MECWYLLYIYFLSVSHTLYGVLVLTIYTFFQYHKEIGGFYMQIPVTDIPKSLHVFIKVVLNLCIIVPFTVTVCCCIIVIRKLRKTTDEQVDKGGRDRKRRFEEEVRNKTRRRERQERRKEETERTDRKETFEGEVRNLTRRRNEI